MKVQVKTFGSLTDILAKEFYITANDTTELMATLSKQHVELAHRSILIAVNNTIIKKSVIFQENDIVALMPPYSGG
ncbi:MoaD/ThiS family protein [Sphingobacterium sp.]|uniref:MoaD/ThiS family protein n=1 Tax=Sphingobacterium sp. TaxID=341027 RepID=UPI0028977A4F|nr:MoaD/ThiS family protein [Sphingobacterium sp.]